MIIRFLCFFLVGLLTLSSCVEEESFTHVESGELPIEFHLDVPGVLTVNTKAAAGTVLEEQIDQITALVFDANGTLAYMPYVELNKTNSTVTLKMRKSTALYQVMLLANCADAVISAGFKEQTTTLADVQAALTFSITDGAKWILEAAHLFPMWGITEKFAVTAGITKNVALMRSLARIDVGINFSATTNGNEAVDGLTGDYSLTSVNLYRMRTSGYIIPQAANLSSDGKAVTAPSVSTTFGTAATKLTYAVTGDMLVRELYLPENSADGASTQPATPTVLVVGIAHAGTTSYYRIDLAATNSAKRLPVLRNHRYIVNIKNITGRGFDSPDEARDSNPWNIEWDVKLEDTGNTGGYVSGGYYFKTAHEVLLSGDGGKTKTIAFETNVPVAETTNADDFVKNFTLVGGTSPVNPTNITYQVTNKKTVEATISGVKQRITTGNFSFTTTTSNVSDAAVGFTLFVHLAPIDQFDILVMQDKQRERYDIIDAVVHGLYLPVLHYGDGTTTRTYPLIKSIHTMTLTLRTLATNHYETNETATWNIHTNRVNGFDFSGSGLFKDAPHKTSGQYTDFTVTLTAAPDGATNIPQTGGYTFFTLSAEGLVVDTSKEDPTGYFDSKGQPRTVRVLVGYPAKTMLTHSWYDFWYGYAADSGASKLMLKAEANFGLSGTVPVEKVATIHSLAGDMTVTQNADVIKKLASNPDILILGFEFRFDSNAGAKVVDYINKGGVVLMFADGLYSSYMSMNLTNVINKLGFSLQSGLGGGPGAIYDMPASAGSGQHPTATDYIMNGPFKSLWGTAWGEDASTTQTVSGLSGNNHAVVYSTYGGNENKVTMFRTKSAEEGVNNTYKGALFFVGDGGFISNHDHEKYPTIEPFWTDRKDRPIPCTSYARTVNNSEIFGNMMFWAIDYAQFYGINRSTEDYSSWGK